MVLSALSLFRKRHPPVGSRPGTLVVTGEDVPPRIYAITYDRAAVTEGAVEDVSQLDPRLRTAGVHWIDVQGLGDEKVLRQIGRTFGLHTLVLEDLVNVPQRPKIEDYPDQLLLITRMARLSRSYGVDIEQVALLIGPNWVLSVQERYGDVFDPVRARIREGKGPIRESGADYLAYALLDTIVDGYYPVFEELGEVISRLESRMLARPSPHQVDRVNQLKAALDTIRRGLWPQLEALHRLPKEETRFISPPVRLYLRDTQDHCAQLVDALDSYREMVNGLVHTYLSVLSNRTNEVMKVLTILASIFIPLTFLAGIYGMNFEAMPELHSTWGYPAVLLLMLLTAGGMLLYFRKRGWLGQGSDEPDEDGDQPRPGGGAGR